MDNQIGGSHPVNASPLMNTRESSEELTTGNAVPLLISAGYDQCIKFWDVARGEQYHNITQKESQVNTMQISPDGLLLATAGWQNIRIFNVGVPPPALATSCEALTKNITAIGFDERCKWFYTGSEDCSTRIWDFRSGLHCRRNFQVSTAVNCVSLHPNQITLIITDVSGGLYFWDLRRDISDSFPNLNLDIFEHITYTDINKTADMLIGVTNKGKVIVWSMSTSSEHALTSTNGLKLQQISKVSAHSKYALKCHFSPDCKYFATTGADGFIHLWDVNAPTRPTKSLYVASKVAGTIHPEEVESRWIWDCAFTSDSKYLFTSSGCQLKLWDLESEEMVRRYQGHYKMISCFTFRDG